LDQSQRRSTIRKRVSKPKIKIQSSQSGVSLNKKLWSKRKPKLGGWTLSIAPSLRMTRYKSGRKKYSRKSS
jgi:hypothetical protein